MSELVRLASENPAAFSLLVLAAVLVTALSPKLIAVLVTRIGGAPSTPESRSHSNSHSNAHTHGSGGGSHRSAPNEMQIERARQELNRRLLDRLESDLLQKIEERGTRLHELASEVNELTLLSERQEREIEEMKRKIERLIDQHNAIALDFVEVKADVRHTKEKVEELCERIERIEAPIALVAAWVTQRQMRAGPETP